MLRSRLGTVAVLAAVACKPHAEVEAHETQDAAPETEPPAIGWWTQRVAAAIEWHADGESADVDSDDAWVGPSAALIRPPDRPIDVRRFEIPDGVHRQQVQDACDAVWLVCRALPPTRDRRTFFDRLYRLARAAAGPFRGRAENPSDLGFGIARDSAFFGAELARCELNVASYEEQVFLTTVTCFASRPIATEARSTAPIQRGAPTRRWH